MLTKHASEALAGKPSAGVRSLMDSVSEADLRSWVERLSVPRHYVLEPEENEGVALWIAAQLQSWGYTVRMQGEWRNVVAMPRENPGPLTLVGAHYDSVGGCPGADDNASAVAAMLGCAKAFSALRPAPSVCFVSFNREEDNLLGSQDFVQWLGVQKKLRIGSAHVLEMVGFATDEPASQRIPPGLPVNVPSTGNFLGLLANQNSKRMLGDVLQLASTYLPALPVIGLHVT